MKLKYEFVVNEVADKFVAVVVGEGMSEFGGFIKMNDIGAYIFKKLSVDTTEEDIVADMINDFPENTEEEIRAAVDDFVGNLKKNNLLNE